MTLSVLTLNLWNDDGPWELRSDRIREWIDRLDPDVIGFQEALRSEAFDQVASLLEERLPHRDYVRAASWKDPGTEFGNAVASRWPITERTTLELPDLGDGETRAALSVTLDAPFGPISFTVTHIHWKLDHGFVRERQVLALADHVLARTRYDGFPSLLVGDMNAEPDSAEMRFLCGLHSLEGRSVHLRDAWREAGDGGAGLTFSRRNDYAAPWLEPNRRIDYIFATPPRRIGLGLVERCRVVCDDVREGVWPSDHFGVFAEIRCEPFPESADSG